MRVLLRNLIVCAGVGCASVALAQPKGPAPKGAQKAPKAPKVSARQQHALAVKADENGEYEKALEAIAQGLAVAPKDLKLLGLKGAVLLKMRDYPGALAAYQAFLAAGAAGAGKREAQKIVENLYAVKSTFLDVKLANGPAEVYLDSKTQGAFCRAEPSCNRAILPGQYKVIVERAGFESWTERITVEKDRTTNLAVTLVENPSVLTVRVAQPGARIAVDGAPYTAPGPIAAGKHQVVVSLAGHAEARLEAVAREGKPIELDVSLIPIAPIRVEPAGAELLLDGKPVVIRADGHLEVPPGVHQLVVRAPGFRSQEIEIPAVRGADYKLEVELAREVAETPAVASEPGRFTTQRKIAIAVGGVGLVALGTGAALQATQFEDDGTQDADQRRKTRALQYQLAYGAGGLAVAVAIGLWLDGAPGPRAGRVAITPRLDSIAGLDLAVRF